MAYHNMDKNPGYPVLSASVPSAPVRYEPEVQLQPVYAAQPVHAQPGAPLPPMAQPVAIPFAYAAAQPPVAEAVEPGVYVPPPMSPAELKAVLSRRVDFNTGKYFREAGVFFKFNCCKLVFVTLLWGVVLISAGCAIGRIHPITYNSGSGEPSFPRPPIYFDTPENPPTVNMSLPSMPNMNMNMSMPSWPTMHTYVTSQIKSISPCKMALKFGLLIALTIFVAMPAMAGYFVAVFNAMKLNGPIRFRDFFAGFKCCYFCRLLPLSICLKLMTGLLSLLLVLPGVWFALVTVFAVPLHREHRFLGTCGSMRFSMKVVHKYFCSFFALMLAISLLQVLGFFLFGVGLLFTMPYALVVLCFCYNDLIGINEMPMLVAQPVSVHV